ncbi:MAG: glycerol-3-phosphate 1-O-acyltransferase PlsY [Leptothrix ochracea]|uniref:glycerol-3-phosphate 1-O-acyltransferase PlsY n=1 Tax=Leptothrix ochracea TaxID=735331 RepID=UPI0034E2B777
MTLTTLAWTLAFALVAYLMGSLSFAVIVSRAMGLSDPRSYGSGNPGATNVLRSGNKKAAILTLVLDAVKGTIAVLIAAALIPRLNVGLGEGTLAWVGLAAFVGHVWPVFFKFEGGKGVATAAGVLLALNIWLGLAVLGVWLAVAFTTRYSSLAAILAALAAPFLHVMVWDPSAATLPMVVMCVILVWRHQGNIAKLIKGTEGRIGQKAAVVKPVVTSHHPHSSHHKH